MKYEEVLFPNKYNDNFRLRIYYDFNKNIKIKHLTMVYLPNFNGRIPIRIHSECLTGDVFKSKRCDCNEQLDYSMKYIANKKKGIVFYMPQEGRGIGLINKIKTYKLQEFGIDTFESNLMLNLPIDNRRYEICEEILLNLGINEIELLTNNPIKINSFKTINVYQHPVIIRPNKFNEKYINDKKIYFNKIEQV